MARSLALHAAVARRLADEPALVDVARARVESWRTHAEVAPAHVEAWSGLLAAPLPELLARLVEPSPEMHELRQVSPFAGVLDPRTRWAILREVAAGRAP